MKEFFNNRGNISNFNRLLVNNFTLKAISLEGCTMIFEFLNESMITIMTLLPNFLTSSTLPAFVKYLFMQGILIRFIPFTSIELKISGSPSLFILLFYNNLSDIIKIITFFQFERLDLYDFSSTHQSIVKKIIGNQGKKIVEKEVNHSQKLF